MARSNFSPENRPGPGCHTRPGRKSRPCVRRPRSRWFRPLLKTSLSDPRTTRDPSTPVTPTDRSSGKLVLSSSPPLLGRSTAPSMRQTMYSWTKRLAMREAPEPPVRNWEGCRLVRSADAKHEKPCRIYRKIAAPGLCLTSTPLDALCRKISHFHATYRSLDRL